MSDLYAKHLTMMTLVGAHSDTYPYKRGNCFSVMATDGKEYKIVNFVAENFKALHKFGCASPIKIKVLAGKTAVIHDDRIPANWYRKDFCEVCTPASLLPMPQQLAHERLVSCGAEKQLERCTQYIMTLAPQWPELPVER